MNLASLKLAANHGLLITKKHSPVWLTAVGIAGAITSTVLACRATLKVEDPLDELNERRADLKDRILDDSYTETDRRKDLTHVYLHATVDILRLYAPAAVVGVASYCAIAGGQTIMQKRNAALTVAYTTLEQGYSAYRKRVVEEIGEERELQVFQDAEEIEVVDEKTGEKQTVFVPRAGSIYARMFDRSNGSWCANPDYNRFFLQAQLNYANDMLNSRGHVTLNDVYDMLGFDRTPEGQIVGWLKFGDGDGYIDFALGKPGDLYSAGDHMGTPGGFWLDFNVDGIIYDKI